MTFCCVLTAQWRPANGRAEPTSSCVDEPVYRRYFCIKLPVATLNLISNTNYAEYLQAFCAVRTAGSAFAMNSTVYDTVSLFIATELTYGMHQCFHNAGIIWLHCYDDNDQPKWIRPIALNKLLYRNKYNAVAMPNHWFNLTLWAKTLRLFSI